MSGPGKDTYWTVFCRSRREDNQTTYVTGGYYPTKDEAISNAVKECAESWDDLPADVEPFGVISGDCKIEDWVDVGEKGIAYEGTSPAMRKIVLTVNMEAEVPASLDELEIATISLEIPYEDIVMNSETWNGKEGIPGSRILGYMTMEVE